MGKKQIRKEETYEVIPVGMRIIGGEFGGRKIAYAGDRRVRPMKDRVREAIFNLIHMRVKDSYIIDLFGGTGALALESLSRGAKAATICEQHFPTARVITDNVKLLNVEARVCVRPGDVFLWNKRNPVLPQDIPWTVFCCPPYRFFQERTQDVYDLLESLIRRAPDKSLFVVEADTQFNWMEFNVLGEWEIHAYPPAVVGFLNRRLNEKE
ncbi:MAG: RsmD family RNA methyltransferase [Planctomycetia bacterium]|nr:RsmD family RNA methyltransferase [Planctomycetia bacterium]